MKMYIGTKLRTSKYDEYTVVGVLEDNTKCFYDLKNNKKCKISIINKQFYNNLYNSIYNTAKYQNVAVENSFECVLISQDNVSTVYNQCMFWPEEITSNNISMILQLGNQIDNQANLVIQNNIIKRI